MNITAKVIDFKSGPKNARWFGGKFNGSVWSIPTPKTAQLPSSAFSRFLDNPKSFGLEIVSDGGIRSIETCSLWTLDQGCPLHGELCARGRG